MFKKMCKKRILPMGMAVALFFGIGLSDVSAQNLTNTGTINNRGTGTIRLRANNGQFRNNVDIQANITNDGVIEMQGTDNTFTDENGLQAGTWILGDNNANKRVPGNVRYNAAAGAQNVHSRWYTNLEMAAASTKTIIDAVYVSGTYTAAGGNRTYTGTFGYDGTAAQDIFAEIGLAGTNQYNNLIFQSTGVKTLQALNGNMVVAGTSILEANMAGLTVLGQYQSGGEFTQNGGAPISVTGAGAILEFRSDAALEHTVAVNGDNTTHLRVDNVTGTPTVVSNNAVTITNGTMGVNGGNWTVGSTGSLDLGNVATAALNVADTRTLRVTGTFANAFGAATNMTYDPASFVIYDGAAAQSIVSTVTTNPYGSLTVETAGEKVPAGDVFLATNFALADANLPMGAHTLHMTNNAGTATYDDSHEVTGRMRRLFASATTPLTFNNVNTQLTLTAAEAEVTAITLNVRPGAFSTDHTPPYAAATDVNRVVNFDYEATGTAWSTTMTYGFLPGENPSDVTARPSLRFREVNTTTTPTTLDKIATGQAVTTPATAGGFESRSLAAIIPFGGSANTAPLAGVADNGEIVLRGGPTQFISIVSGRWANPATWDEGAEPGPSDDVIIDATHQVHVGGVGVNRDPYTTDEAHPTEMANSLEIRADGALVIMNSDPGGITTYNFSTGATITNAGDGAVGAITDANTFLNTTTGNFPGRGIIIFEGGIRANNLVNSGLIYNDGVVEIGD